MTAETPARTLADLPDRDLLYVSGPGVDVSGSTVAMENGSLRNRHLSGIAVVGRHVEITVDASDLAETFLTGLATMYADHFDRVTGNLLALAAAVWEQQSGGQSYVENGWPREAAEDRAANAVFARLADMADYFPVADARVSVLLEPHLTDALIDRLGEARYRRTAPRPQLRAVPSVETAGASA